MIKCLFNKDDARLILGLPCTDFFMEDKLLWHYTKNGKSGYHVAMSSNLIPENLKAMKTKTWWRAIWEMRVANYIKQFFLETQSFLDTN